MKATTSRPSETLRAEHELFRREAANLARVAGELGEWSVPDSPDQLRHIRGFLYGHLLPHAEAEEAILYPLMDKVMGATGSTVTMVADHKEIRRGVDALTKLIGAVGTGPPSNAQREGLRQYLYSLWAILRLHLDKEETILFAQLDERLSHAAAATLMEQLEEFTADSVPRRMY